MWSRLSLPKSLLLLLHGLLLTAAAVLLALHAVHLSADFPNYSRWMDWSKYTDEGWYGDAAIRHFQLGHWYVPGDFNPAVALPVWPLAEGLLFRFTGVSLPAARALTVAVFAGILLCSWLLLNRWRSTRIPSFAASAAVLLLAASPYIFNFTRLAILEPMLVFVALLALLAASSARPGLPFASPRNLAVLLALALLLPALVLTKTTGLFLTPAVAWLLFAAMDFRLRPFLRTGVPAAVAGALLWLAWYGFVVHPHFLLDYRYLFAANAYTGISRANAAQVLFETARDGFWMGYVVYPCALAAALAGLLVCWSSLRRLRAYPLITALLLWAGGYYAFLIYHDNLQPRYYLVVTIPLTLLLPLVLEQLAVPRVRPPAARAVLLLACAALLLTITIPDAALTLSYVRHPEYTLLDAARDIRSLIADDQLKHPQHNPLVLSISGSDLSLMTGLPSICDDFGTLELADRVKKYRPGWYVAWNQIDDDKMDAMTPLYHIERVAAFPAMDDPDRNLLILYRLDPAQPTPPPKRKKAPMPTRLQTKVGQQPSVEQLEH